MKLFCFIRSNLNVKQALNRLRDLSPPNHSSPKQSPILVAAPHILSEGKVLVEVELRPQFIVRCTYIAIRAIYWSDWILIVRHQLS